MFAGRDADQAVSSVVSDLLGGSGLRILHALAQGETDPQEIGGFGRPTVAVQRGATGRCFDRKLAADAPGNAGSTTRTSAADRYTNREAHRHDRAGHESRTKRR